jgi:hypothetical protein
VDELQLYIQALHGDASMITKQGLKCMNDAFRLLDGKSGTVSSQEFRDWCFRHELMMKPVEDVSPARLLPNCQYCFLK